MNTLIKLLVRQANQKWRKNNYERNKRVRNSNARNYRRKYGGRGV